MEMCYNEALVMPRNYVVLDSNEMEYLEGGGTLSLTISSNSLIISILAGLGVKLTFAKATAALTAAMTAISTAIFLGSAGTLALYAGAFLIAFGSVIPTIASIAVGHGINSLKGKSFDIVNIPLIPDLNVSV
ncbi:UNVERIFIED_CONTAM: hypothetical protein Cloal_0227 [Acetivibrio alkalicellulosi]